MNLKSIPVVLGLGVLGSLFSLSLVPTIEFNIQKNIAQELAVSCPLPPEIAATFLDSKCEEVKLAQPQHFYRYYSSDGNKYGRYLTTDKYKTNVEVIRKLALNQDWGNQATMMLKVTLPAGTMVYQGIVAPQNPAACYPGGGQQTFIKDSRDPNIKWDEKKDMTVETFSCP
jgi:hypothetical protein